ncbi:MAG: hypothetical protein ACKV2Q_32970 [Planctomycetaceae bacterium]
MGDYKKRNTDSNAARGQVQLFANELRKLDTTPLRVPQLKTMLGIRMKPQLPEFDGIVGAAFLLRTPAHKSITLQHEEGVVTVRQDAPYITVQLEKAPPDCDLRSKASQVLLEALDIHAATHRDPIGTHRVEREYLTWTRANDGYQLTIADTAHIPWSISGQGTVTHARAGAPSVPATTQIPHHASFRFYRLSQLTEDLFDAYRNAYLALECLVSDISPKVSSESEVNWLKRVLSGPLSAGVSVGMSVDATVDELYGWGRLPLFHAKTGKSFYSPQGEERERVQTLFYKLNVLLASLYRHKFGPRFSGGWARLADPVKDSTTRVVLQYDEVVFKNESEQISCQPHVEVIDQPRRFGNLWAMIEVAPPAKLLCIDGIELRHGGEERGGLDFPESVPMARVTSIRIEIHVLNSNARAPNPSHSM